MWWLWLSIWNLLKVLTDGWECEKGRNKWLQTEEPALYCCTGCSSTWSFSCSRQSNSSSSWECLGGVRGSDARRSATMEVRFQQKIIPFSWRNAMPSSLSPAQFWTHSAFSVDNEVSLSSLGEHWQYHHPERKKIVCATTFWLSWSMCKLAAYRQPGPHRPYARCTAWLLKGSSQLSWCHPYSSSSLSQPRWGSRLSVWSHCSSCPSTQNIYTPNKLGLVLASLKGNYLHRCWILPAIRTGSVSWRSSWVKTGKVVVIKQMVTLVVDVLRQP